jgi:hypothetical protein
MMKGILQIDLLEPDFRSTLILATLEKGMSFWTPSLLYEPVHPTQPLMACLTSPSEEPEHAWLLSRVINELDPSQVPPMCWQAFQEAVVKRGRGLDSWILLRKSPYCIKELVIPIVEHHDLLALLQLALGMLSEESVRPDGRNSNNETALHIAARRRNLGMVLLLLANGADPNAGDSLQRTALHNGCQSYLVTSALLLYGADRWAMDNRSRCPLDVCRSTTAQFILAKGRLGFGVSDTRC